MAPDPWPAQPQMLLQKSDLCENNEIEIKKNKIKSDFDFPLSVMDKLKLWPLSLVSKGIPVTLEQFLGSYHKAGNTWCQAVSTSNAKKNSKRRPIKHPQDRNSS